MEMKTLLEAIEGISDNDPVADWNEGTGSLPHMSQRLVSNFMPGGRTTE